VRISLTVQDSTTLSQRPTGWREIGIGVLLITLASVLSYSPIVHNEFVDYDDPDYLTQNPHVSKGLNAATWRWAWTSYDAANWHPITWLSHLLDVSILGQVSPVVTHVENVVWHGASSALLFVLLARSTGRYLPSLAVGLFFLLHPANVEAVAWGAQRKGVLSTFFGIATIGAYGCYVAGRTKGSRVCWYAASIVLAALCLFAKPTWVPLPIFLFLVDLWPLGRRMKPAVLIDKIPFALLAFWVVWITLQAQEVAMDKSGVLPLSIRVPTAFSSLVWYLGLLVWPVHLSVLYPHPLQSPPAERLLLATLIVVGISTFAWVVRRVPAIGVGWMGFLVSLVPTIGLVQVGVQVVADRYGYLSFIGLFVAICFGWWSLTEKWGVADRASIGLLVVLATLLGGLTYQQVGRWRDSITLFSQAASVTTNNYVAYSHLSQAYFEKGDIERAGYFSEQVVQSGLRSAAALTSLATFRARQGRISDAEELAREAIERNPRFADAYVTLAQILQQRGRRAEAVSVAKKSLEIDPENIEARKIIDRP
jgi:hypothetical protein